MSSYEDRLRERRNKYTDSNKESTQESKQETNVTPVNTINYNERMSQRKAKYSDNQDEIDASFIDSFLSDARKYTIEGTSLNARLGVDTSSSIYAGRKETAEDLRSRSWAISRYLEKNKDSVPEEYYTALKGYLDSFDQYTSQSLYSTYKANRFYSQFDSEEAYKKWLQHSTPEGRQEQYENNQTRLEELRQQKRESYNYQPGNNPYLTGESTSVSSPYGATRQDPNLLIDDTDREMAQIKKEMRLYEIGEADADGFYYGSKVLDDYGKYLENDAFVSASENRDYQNADRATLDAYDESQSEGSLALTNGGYFDEEGNIRNAKGTIVQYASAPEVQDKLGLFLSASDDDIVEAYNILSASNGNYETTWADIMQEGDTKRWKYLKDDEMKIYYGLLKTEGQESAYRYLDAMEVELGRRETAEIYAAIEETSGLEQVMLNVASVPMNMIGGIAATVDNATRLVKGEDINPYSRAQTFLGAGNYIRSNTAQEINDATAGFEIPGLGFTLGDAYQAGMSMVDSLVGARIGGKAYQAIMSMGAASTEMARLYSQGASMDQMVLGSVAAGAAEWVFEKYSIENLIDLKSPETLMQFAKNALIQGGIEMSEEAATEFANIIANGLIMQSESDWAKVLEENGGDYGKAAKEMAIRIANAGLSGFLSGVGSGSLQQGMQYGAQQQANAELGKYIAGADSTDALMALALDMASGESGRAQNDLKNQSQRIMDDDYLTKRGKNKAIGRLYNTVRSVVTEQNISEISVALQEKGFSKKDATAIAGAVAVQANGIELSDKQQKVLEKFGSNEDVQSVLSEVMGNEESGINQRSKSIAKFEFGAMRNHIISSIEKELPRQENADESDNVDAQSESSAEGSYEVSAEGKTILKSTGDIVNIREVAAIKDGHMTLRLDDGSTVDAGDVSYASEEEALVYETVARMCASTRAANILVNGFKSAEGLSASAYAHGIEEAFRYGMHNDERGLAKSVFASKLNPGQRDYAYRQGQKAAGKQVAKEQATVRKNRAAAEAATAGKVSSRSYQAVLEDGITEKSLNESQRVSYHLAGQVAEAAKVNIRVYAGKTGEWGYYNPNTDEIYLNLNATNKSRKSMMAFTLGHELVHRAKKGSPAKYKAFANFLVEEYGKSVAIDENGKRVSIVEKMVAEQMDAAKDHNIKLTYDQAFEEVVCDACQRMLLDTDAGKKLAEFGAQSKENKSFLENLKQWIEEFLDKLRSIFEGVEPDSLAAKEFAKFDAGVKQILADMYVDMTIDAGENLSIIQNAFGKGTVVETNDHGEFTMASSQDGSERLFNLTTWNNGGRETLEATLLREGYTEDEVNAALAIMDGKQQLVQDIANELNDNGNLAFPEQGRINEATLTTDMKDGHSVLSALVSNGDYPVNIDLLMVCKKRKAYQRVINRLCETGMIQQATVDALAIAEINKILGKYGFETACLGCFVESRRLRIQEWAQTICKEWNAEVKKRNPNAKAFGFGKGEATLTPEEVMKIIGELESGGEKNDNGNLNLGKGSAVKRMGVLLDKVPSLRRTLSIEDLITPDGLSSLRSFDSNLFSMVKSRYGTNSPKFVQEFNPYNHELAMYGKVPSEYKSLREYLYAIGGARMQSFSDFIVENWFDYCQIVADLAARKLPMHTYTKEIALAKLFGLTGIKINMSLIPDIDRSLGKEFAGLTRNEKGELELIWADKDRFKKTGGKSYMQSINFADAMALQEDPRYSANVGTIAVGVSDRHIEMMLDDPRIRMVIPYHSSGMNPIFADLMGTSYYKDYTNFQNTTVKQIYNSKGQRVSLKLDKTQTGKLTAGFQFNEVLQDLGDARAAAEAYKDWCADASKHTITIKGETYTAELAPKFDDFSGHENYYKLLEDFNTYDCISEQAAPQGDVQQIYPEDFDNILKAEMKAQEGHRQKQEANQAFDKAMGEIEGYLKNHSKADTVYYAKQHGIKLGDKDKKLNAAEKAKLKKLQEEGSSFKLPTNPYSYDNLTSKPDMVVTTVGGNVPKNRADLVHEAKQNAAKVGKFDPKTGSVSVHVKDIGRYVGIGRDGLKHSLDGGRISVNGPVIAKVGEILSNSIRINELTPREDNIDESYVLIGAAKNADGELYVVRSVVNRYTHKLVSVDALYAVNAKKEPAALLPLLTGNPAVGTDSTISIAELLDYVNKYFPDILPEEVLKHYGHDSRPEGKLGPDALYKLPVGEDTSPRALLSNAFESVVTNPIEKRNLQEYKKNVAMLNEEEAKLRELREQIKELSFAKGKRDTKKIKELQFDANQAANRIATLDKILLRFEVSAPLQGILQREKDMVRKRERQRKDEALAAYRLKAEAKQSEILRDYRETKAALRGQKSDTAVIEKEFIRIAKAYEKLDAKTTAKIGKDTKTIADLKAALKEETQKHRADQKTWEAEFNRLLREYEAADRSIDRLEAKIERQQQMAKKSVDDRKRSALRDKIKSFKARLESSLLTPTDRRYVPIDLIKAMVEVCELVETDTDLYNADGSINKAQEKRNLTKEKLQNLKDEYEKLKTHSDPIYAGEFDEMVYAYLTELRDNYSGKNLKEMSLDELTAMYEILRAIEETLQDARKLIGWGDAESVYEAGDAIVAEQDNITKSRKGGKRNAAQKAMDASLNLSLSPVRNVERMSGYHANSFLLKLFKKFEQGIRKKNKFVMEAYKSFEGLTSGKEYDNAMYTEVGGKKYEDVNGRKFGISKMQMMQAILSQEREAANNMHHIEGSGFSFADLDMLRKGRLRDAISEEYSHRVPAATNLVAEFTEALKNDKWCQDYMKAARKFFNGTAKDAINETSIALKHRIIAKDKSYIPFEVDKNFVVREISAENDIQQTINSYGMMKETKKGASQPLIITGLNNILDRHIDQVGNVYGLAIEVRNFNKVWNVRSLDAVSNDPTVKAAIQRNWGVEGVKHIEQAVQDIQGPRHSEQSALYKKVKSGYINSTFLLNLSVVTKQIGSLFSATSMLKWRGPVRMMGNLVSTMANHKKISAEVDKYTATAWMRRQGLSDAELHTFMTEGKKSGFGRLVGKLPAALNPGKWIAAMDSAVALSLWKYAKIDTAKRTGLKGEELLKATAEFYDEVIENTQSMTDMLHRPEIQKRSDIISESLGMFKTDLYQMAGQLQVTAGRFTANKTKENGRALGRTVYAIAMSAVWAQLMTTVFALLRYKVKQYRDDDDEELTVESWLNRQKFSLAGDLMGYILPIFGSEIVGLFENIMYGESDDIVDSLALTAINDLYNAMITVGSAVKEGEMPKPEDMKKLAIKALQVFGVPANNIIRTYEAIHLHAKDIANGEFFSFEAGVNRSPKQHIHRIVEAVDAGNIDVAVGLYEEALEETAIEKSKDGSYGEDELSDAKSDLKSALGNKYRDGEVSRDLVNRVLVNCFDMDKDEAKQTIGKWDFKIQYGYAWTDRSDAYLDGAISAREFKKLLMDIGGKTADEADEYIEGLDFEAKHGFAWSELDDSYKSGEISASELRKILVDVGGKTEEEADLQIQAYDWQADGYEGTTAAAVRDYNEYCAGANVPKDVYLYIRSFSNNTENDVDEATGKTINYSAMKKIMAEIDAQPGLTAAQKTAIAKSLGWSDKNIQKYKLW